MTITRFQHNDHLVKENIINEFKCYYSKCMYQFNFILHQNAQSFHSSSETETYSCKKTLFSSQNCLTHGNNFVIMSLFSIEIVYLFPEVTVGVVK